MSTIEYQGISCDDDPDNWNRLTSQSSFPNNTHDSNRLPGISRRAKILVSIILGGATALIAKPIVDPLIPQVAEVRTSQDIPRVLPPKIDTTPQFWTTIREDGSNVYHTHLANGFEMNVTGDDAVEGFWEATLETLDRIERMTNGVNTGQDKEKIVVLDTSNNTITFAEQSLYEGKYQDFALGIFKASKYGVSPDALKAFVTYYLENIGGFDKDLSNNYAQAFELYMLAAQPEPTISLMDARQFARDESQVFEDWMSLWKKYNLALEKQNSLALKQP